MAGTLHWHTRIWAGFLARIWPGKLSPQCVANEGSTVRKSHVPTIPQPHGSHSNNGLVYYHPFKPCLCIVRPYLLSWLNRLVMVSIWSVGPHPFGLDKEVSWLVHLQHTVMILSFRTDKPGQTVQTQLRRSLIRVYTVCHSVCIIWTHYSMVEPHSSNFRVITTNFWVSEYLGNLR